MTRALVLAGGGVTGIAWETGVLLGLGITAAELDLVVGTSAGSVVGAQLLSGTPPAELYARQVASQHREIAPDVDLDRVMSFFMEMGDLSHGTTPELLRKVGAFAKQTESVALEARRAVIEWRLPSHDWPTTPLQVTTVDVDTGELFILDAASGVPLVDAVMASCAVPGVWPTVPLLSRVLMDGGLRSITNLDLVQGYDDVLVLAPMAQGPMLSTIEREVAALTATGSTVTVVLADDRAVTAMGANPLDPAQRPVSAEHGLRQGRNFN
jgi:NTE family protein